MAKSSDGVNALFSLMLAAIVLGLFAGLTALRGQFKILNCLAVGLIFFTGFFIFFKIKGLPFDA
jgi:predicted branched-subunit amino acid permease